MSGTSATRWSRWLARGSLVAVVVVSAVSMLVLGDANDREDAVLRG